MLRCADPGDRLAVEQERLVSALLLGAASPPGFDAVRLRVAADSLHRKRERVVARAWPALVEALGPPRFRSWFSRYAAAHARPLHADGLVDGRAFARWLAARRALPDEGVVELVGCDLCFELSAHGARPRTRPAVRIGVLPVSRRLVIAARWPVIGERWFRVPWGRPD